MRRATFTILLTLLGVLLAISLTHARPQQGQIAGIALASSGSLLMSGTLGQPDAGMVSGGIYGLSGGFWPGAQADYRLRLPLLRR
jgi:hypothetical protein